MIPTATYVVEAALALTAIFVAVRSPRHRIFAAWISFALAYTLANHVWIEPVLGRLPRPFTGGARGLLHLSQFLFVAVHVSFVHVVFDLARVRRIVRPLPAFVGLVAMVVLVDGYGHSPGPGLYRVAGIVFRSRAVYLLLEIAVNALVLSTVLPRLRMLFGETRPTDDMAVLGSVLSLELAAIAQNLFDLAPGRFPAMAMPLGYLLSYAVALGFHAPIAVLHILGDRSPEYLLRTAVARRREAVYETHDRLEASRAAFAEACSTKRPHRGSFPTAGPLVQRAGLTPDFLMLVVEDLVAAGYVEFTLASVWGLGAQEAARLLGQVEEAVSEAASRLGAEGGDEFPWTQVYKESSVGPGTFLAPISMTVFSVLRGLTWDQARDTLRFAHSVAERVARRERPRAHSRASA